jgi:GTPase
MWKHLERQFGGSTMATRGPGEKQIEIDRRAVETKILKLKERIAKIEKERQIQSKQRRHFYRISLVGYTNAGKSSLMNRLTDADTLVANILFSTLDSTTRKLSDGNVSILLTDTVGFIKKLPHTLIQSFKSTLAESRESDLLLIVADCSTPQVFDQIDIVNNVLDEIGAPQNRWLIANKIDLLNADQIAQIRRTFPYANLVSALSGTGIEPLRDNIFAAAKKI